MYRSLLLIIFSVLLTSSCFAATRRVIVRQPYNPYPSAYQSAYYGGNYVQPKYRYHNNRYAQTRFSDLNDLEKYTFNKNFFRENELTRLERLEKQAFGEVQQGDIVTRYDNVRNAILSRPKQNYKTSLLQNLSNYFSGQVTGMTPSLSPYDYNSTTSPSFSTFPYGSNSTTSYSSPWGSGYRVDNYGIGTGTGVRLLD